MEGLDAGRTFNEFLAFQKHRNRFLFALVRARKIENQYIALQHKYMELTDKHELQCRDLERLQSQYWKVVSLPMPSVKMQAQMQMAAQMKADQKREQELVRECEVLAKKLRRAVDKRSMKR